MEISKFNLYQPANNSVKKTPSLLRAAQKQQEHKTYKNIAIGLSALGSVGLATFAIIKTKKIMNLKAVAKEAKELARIKAENLQKTTKAKAEAQAKELARIKAENLQKSAKEKAEAQAKELSLKKEKESLLLKQKEDAVVAAKKLIDENLQKYENKLEELIHIKPMKSKNLSDAYCSGETKAIYSQSNDDFCLNLINTVKEAEQNGMTPKDILKIFKEKSSISNNSIQEAFESYNIEDSLLNDAINLQKRLKDRQKILKEIQEALTKEPSNENKPLSFLMEKINQKRLENVKKSAAEHLESIKRKIKYVQNSEKEPEIVLTKDELEELRKAVKSYSINCGDKYDNADFSTLASRWIQELTDDMGAPKVPERIENACFQSLKKYCSANKENYLKDATYENEPLYRWMSKTNGKHVDEFVNETFTVGENYKFPAYQSCSKNKSYAETYYDDKNQGMNFKFIIHPKSKVSKAFDVERGTYGSNEAIYPKGTEFRVLDKRIEEFILDNPEDYYGTRSFYRWIVEMQEV